MTNVTSVSQIEIAGLKSRFSRFNRRFATSGQDNEFQLAPGIQVAGDGLLEAVSQIFTWQQPTQLLDGLQKWYLDRVYREVRHAFSEIYRQDSEAGQWLSNALDVLPDWALNRFLAAPETRRHISKLRYDTAAHISFFRASLLAEKRLNGDSSVTQSCWSALGDFYLAGINAVNPCRERWRPEFSWVAPRVGSRIPIDFSSPHAQIVNSMPDCPFEAYEPDEVAQLSDLLGKALEVVERVSTSGAGLIDRFVQVIVPRKNPLQPQRGFGSSTPSHIGRLLIRNGHLMTFGHLVDSLVHEAIHGILFVVELSSPFVVDSTAEQPLIRSRWSGKMLPLQTYLHACFVWYGLARFWRKALFAEILPLDVINQLLATALRGFKPTNPIEALLPYSGQIEPRVIECVSRLRHRLEISGELYWEP